MLMGLQQMRTITLLAVLALLALASCKAVEKTLKLSQFPKRGPFVFLTKFHIASGFGQMDITYNKGQELPSEAFYNDISIAMVNQTVLKSFQTAETCNDRLRYIYKREKFNFRQERHGIKHVKLYDLRQEQIWYFYVFSCVEDLSMLATSSEQIRLTFSVTNNGSHFGQSTRLLYAYILVVLIWGYLIFRYADSIGHLLTMKRPDGLKIAIFGGLIMLGAAYLYRLIHIILFSFDGLGVHFFQILYVVLKNIGEAFITTLFIVIAWGWSVVHLKASKFLIFLGLLVGAINITCLVLAFPQEREQFQHHYDTSAGIIVLGLRIFLFLIFITGVCSSLNKSSSYIIFFIKKFATVGSIYLLSWPVIVLLVEGLLPDYLQHQAIIIIEQVVHLSICTLICNMTSSPESAYRRISLQQDDNPFKMKDYKK